MRRAVRGVLATLVVAAAGCGGGAEAEPGPAAEEAREGGTPRATGGGPPGGTGGGGSGSAGLAGGAAGASDGETAGAGGAAPGSADGGTKDGGAKDGSAARDSGAVGDAGGAAADLAGHWACGQVSSDGGSTFAAVVVGNASAPGTHARNFVFAADGTFHNLSNATTGSNFWFWHDVLSVTKTGSTYVVATRAKAQASCNHGISGPLAWPGQGGPSDSWGVWGDGRPLLSSTFAYRVVLSDATHALFYVGYPAYAFYSAAGAATTAGAATGATDLVFKCEKVARAAWLAAVHIPTGGPGAPAVCTNPP